MFHSCGAVRELIPDLIALGVDVLNPIQPAAAGMAPEGLKRDFGAKLSFHGGIDIQYLLPLESADAVRADVRRRVEVLGEGGGYVLAPSHNLQQDISTENILAMYDLDLRTRREAVGTSRPQRDQRHDGLPRQRRRCANQNRQRNHRPWRRQREDCALGRRAIARGGAFAFLCAGNLQSLSCGLRRISSVYWSVNGRIVFFSR